MAKEDYKGIWVFAEQQSGTLNPVTYELLAKAQELKAHNGEAITAVLLGSKVAHLAAGLIAGGADQVIVAEHENLASYSARPYQAALTQLLASDSGQGQESSPSGIPLFQKANGAFGVLLPVHHDVLQARS